MPCIFILGCHRPLQLLIPIVDSNCCFEPCAWDQSTESPFAILCNRTEQMQKIRVINSSIYYNKEVMWGVLAAFKRFVSISQRGFEVFQIAFVMNVVVSTEKSQGYAWNGLWPSGIQCLWFAFH